MIYVRPGSQVHRLITLLSVVGEFPIQSLGLLGKVRAYKVLVKRLMTAARANGNPFVSLREGFPYSDGSVRKIIT